MSKDVASKKVLESLDNAISDFAKTNTVNFDIKNKLDVLPENFEQVSEMFEDEILVSGETLTETIRKTKAVSIKKVKKIKKEKDDEPIRGKKSNKINSFLVKGSKKAASKTLSVPRETEVLPVKNKKYRTRKSPYFSDMSFNLGGSKLMGKVFNVYNFNKKSLGTGALALMMLFFVLVTTYVTYAYVTANNNDLVNNVARHIVLPENDSPKVYIVQSEKADIFQNPSFKGIKVGDNVLTYTKSGKVIIYRSSEDKIVNIVNLQN